MISTLVKHPLFRGGTLVGGFAQGSDAEYVSDNACIIYPRKFGMSDSFACFPEVGHLFHDVSRHTVFGLKC